MRVDTIRVFLRAMPFKPFVIHLSDGARFVVPHPDFVSVSHGLIVVSQAPGSRGHRLRTTTCDALHVTRIEVVEA